MSTSTPGRAVSPAVVLLSVLLAAATGTAGVLAGLYLGGRPAPATAGGAPAAAAPAPADAEPYPQKGTVQPTGEGSGVVFYPVPYGSPPNLAVEPKARYLIVKQDEFGFTWLDRARTGDATDLLASVPEVSRFLPKGDAPKFDPRQPDLTWEARGVRGAPGGQAMKLFEQSGNFQTDFGQQGQVNFPIPYASPPNVELTGSHEKTVITECTPTGFKWKNGSKGEWRSDAGTVRWKAVGIRATRLPGS